MKKFKIILSVIVVIIIAIVLLDMKMEHDYKTYINDATNYSEYTEIPIPEDSKVLKYEDSHGGFLGDGDTYVIIQLTPQGKTKFVNSANKSDKWSSLPLPRDFQIILYGIKYETSDEYFTEGPMTQYSLPKIENGIYYFRDRYAENYPEEANININERYSYNFTACLFDLDTNKLYIYGLDT